MSSLAISTPSYHLKKQPLNSESSGKPSKWFKTFLILQKLGQSIWTTFAYPEIRSPPSSGLTGQSIQPSPHFHAASEASSTGIIRATVGWGNIVRKLLTWKEVPTLQLRKKSEVPPSCQITLIFTNKMDCMKKKSFIVIPVSYTTLSVSFSQMLSISHASPHFADRTNQKCLKECLATSLLSFCRTTATP